MHRFFHNLGPGIITGAADDDPSGISTYSTAGAALGYGTLWTVPLVLPLMTAVQLMCARLGLVSGRGLAANIRLHYPRWVLWGACSMLIFANLVNIAADFGGMAEAVSMLLGGPQWVWPPLFAAAILGLLVLGSYRLIVRIFKLLTLTLFAYVICAFLAKPNWWEVVHHTLVPQLTWNSRTFAVILALLGTTISPYMFFWQSAQEVEEEKARGHRTVKARRGATPQELYGAAVDVSVGMGWAGLVMYFIILTTGATLHRHGITDIETAQQASVALEPLAGAAAKILYAAGLISTGMLGIPVLAGSAAYAVAEAKHWRGSLNDRPKAGRKFYWIMATAVALGAMLDFLGFNAVKALFWAAVVNGLMSPPLLFLICRLNQDPQVMGEHTSGKSLRVLGWAATVVMSLAALGLIITLFV